MVYDSYNCNYSIHGVKINQHFFITGWASPMYEFPIVEFMIAITNKRIHGVKINQHSHHWGGEPNVWISHSGWITIHKSQRFFSGLGTVWFWPTTNVCFFGKRNVQRQTRNLDIIDTIVIRLGLDGIQTSWCITDVYGIRNINWYLYTAYSYPM